MSKRIPVEPKVLEWARLTAALSVDEAARALGVRPERIESWELGEHSPTINQLRTMAKRFKLPLGAFLATEPPAPAFRLPHDYRREAGLVPPPPSPRLVTQIRLAAERRAQAIELLEDLDEEPTQFDVRANLQQDPEEIGSALREVIKLSFDQQRQWRTPEKALSSFKDLLESAGVLVTQFSQTDVAEARGASILPRYKRHLGWLGKILSTR